VLRVMRKDGVEDPAEAEDRVDYHDDVVNPYRLLDGEDVTKEWVPGIRLEQREIHKKIPNGAVDRIDGSECDEKSQIGLRSVDAIEAEEDGSKNRHGVFAAVDQVWEHVLGVVVTPDALQSTPDGGQCGEEAHETRMVRVAFAWVFPFIGVKTEEERDVL